MSVIFYSLLKGSVLISPDRDVANPTSAQCESTILATVSHGVNLAHGVMGALGGGQ